MLLQFVIQAGKLVQRLEEFLLSASILMIAALTVINVICRSAFGFSLAFTEEVSQFCIIAVCFVGLSYAAGKGRHIRMTAVYDQLPMPLRKAVMVLITASTAIVMFTLAWYAACYVRTVYNLGGVYPALRVPFYVVYAVAPAGLFLAGIQYGLTAIRNAISSKIFIAFDQQDEYEQPVTQEI